MANDELDERLVLAAESEGMAVFDWYKQALRERGDFVDEASTMTREQWESIGERLGGEDERIVAYQGPAGESALHASVERLRQSFLGDMTYCIRCLPYLNIPPYNEERSLGDMRRENPLGKYVDVFETFGEHRRQLHYVEQAIKRRGVPGLILREFVRDECDYAVCGACGRRGGVRRLWYNSLAELDFSKVPKRLYQVLGMYRVLYDEPAEG